MDKDRILEIAEESINQIVIHNSEWLPVLDQDWLQPKRGVFTTLYSNQPNKTLRGCIGIPMPIHPVGHAIAISARKSATQDPRFPRVIQDELDQISLSVEILSEIEPIEYESISDLHGEIILGETGLLVEYQNYSALFLPRVPTEQNWDKDQYLAHLCKKAYIPPSFIGDKPLKFSKFTTEFFEQNEN